MALSERRIKRIILQEINEAVSPYEDDFIDRAYRTGRSISSGVKHSSEPESEPEVEPEVEPDTTVTSAEGPGTSREPTHDRGPKTKPTKDRSGSKHPRWARDAVRAAADALWTAAETRGDKKGKKDAPATTEPVPASPAPEPDPTTTVVTPEPEPPAPVKSPEPETPSTSTADVPDDDFPSTEADPRPLAERQRGERIFSIVFESSKKSKSSSKPKGKEEKLPPIPATSEFEHEMKGIISAHRMGMDIESWLEDDLFGSSVSSGGLSRKTGFTGDEDFYRKGSASYIAQHLAAHHDPELREIGKRLLQKMHNRVGRRFLSLGTGDGLEPRDHDDY